jgi:hypothetical protein
MKNFIKTVGLAAFALALIQSTQAQGSVAGKWKTQFDSQIGTQKYTFEFKLDGAKLTGQAISERQDVTNNVAITNGKIDGDKISFSEPVKIQDNDVVVEYSGTIAGDEIKLHRKVGEFAEYDIVAKRVTDAGAASAAPAASGSVAGKWSGQFDSQIGVQKYTYEFKVDGTSLTGTATGISDNGTNSSAIAEGKINPDTITFVEPLKFGDQDIRIEYTGKVSADEIKLHRKVGEFAEEDLTVKRIP